LPLERAVLARARAEQRQLARLLFRQPRVALAEPAVRGVEVLQPGVSGERSVDAREAVDGPADLLVHAARRRADPREQDRLRRPLRKAARVAGDDLASQRMPDDDRPLEPQCADEVM